MKSFKVSGVCVRENVWEGERQRGRYWKYCLWVKPADTSRWMAPCPALPRRDGLPKAQVSIY